MLVHLLVGACAVGATILVWRRDMYDREPWWALAGTAALGALFMPACGLLEDIAIFAGTDSPSSLWIALNAAFFEGLARLAVTGAVMVLLPRIFNDPMDGITYGSMAGLGMALHESSFYLASGAPGAGEIARLYAHLVLGGIAGFPFGMLRMRMAGGGQALPLCAAAAFLLHAAIDAASLHAVARPEFEGAGTLVVCGAVLAATGLYGFLAIRASAWSKARFDPAGAERFHGWPF